MNEPTLLPVRPGTLTDKDKATLRKASVIVIEHENPNELRLLRPSGDLNGDDLLHCAMRALVVKTGVHGSDQREAFAHLVAAALDSKRAA